MREVLGAGEPSLSFLLTTPYNALSGFAGPAQFDIVLQALDGTQLIARKHIVVNVAAP